MPAYKYQTKQGKTLWYANFYYVDWKGVRQHKCKRGFATRREALEYETSFKNQGTKDPTITFSGLVENYLSEYGMRLKPTTLAAKRYILMNKLVPVFGHLKICDIDAITVHRWQNELLGHVGKNGKGYAGTYLKTMHSELSAVMNYAVKYYQLRSNPCIAAGSIGKSHAQEMKFWTREQFECFLSFVGRTSYHVAFSILFYAGLRCGELLALTPDDILPDASININKNYEVVEGTEYILTPKTEKGKRIVTIPKSLHEEIMDFIGGMLISHDERIFYFGHGGLTAELKRTTTKAGLPPIRLHDTRHSHASMLIDMGFSIKEIADRLGHESPQTTWRTYAHLYPGKGRELADELDAVRIKKSATRNNISEK